MRRTDVNRIVIVCLLAFGLAGCAAAGKESAPPPVAPVPETAPLDTTSPPAAPAESEDVPLRERWREPFAVQSSGRPAPRPPRPAVVVLDATLRPPGAPTAADTGRTTPADFAPAPSGTPAAPAPAASVRREETRTHRVAAGETFYGIALRYGVTYSELLTANPGADPQRIRIGQALRIPPAGSRPAPKPAPRRVHTVAAGETLWGIARKYGLAPERIRAANKLPDDQIRVGQTLIIPDP